MGRRMNVPTIQARLRISVTKIQVPQLRSGWRETAKEDTTQTSTSPPKPTRDLPMYPIVPLARITDRYAAPEDGSHTRAGSDDSP